MLFGWNGRNRRISEKRQHRLVTLYYTGLILIQRVWDPGCQFATASALSGSSACPCSLAPPHFTVTDAYSTPPEATQSVAARPSVHHGSHAPKRRGRTALTAAA